MLRDPAAWDALPGRSPCDVVERALRLSFTLDEGGGNLIQFLDAAGEVAHCSMASLSEAERLTFSLNLYHLLIQHAYLVLGPPTSMIHWLSYYSVISYQTADDIFSLAELEHCVVRAQLSPPSSFFSKIAIPSAKFGCALTTSDWRLNFALNCGSVSNPPAVPIYRAATIHEQLDRAARYFLSTRVQVRANKGGGALLVLPRVMSWFNKDFGSGSTEDCVRAVARFLPEKPRTALEAALDPDDSSTGALSVKIAPFEFRCSALKLIDLAADSDQPVG